MIRRIPLVLALLCAIPCLAQHTYNNTPACLSGTSGCNASFAGLNTNPAYSGAQTHTPDPAPAFVSTITLPNLLYSGATTRVVMHYQPWWCNSSTPCNGHINIGMNEDNTPQVTAQLTSMKALGVNSVNVDYYGSTQEAYNLSVTNVVNSVIASAPSSYPTLMLTLDQGAIDDTGAGQCPPAGGDQSACLEAALDAQLDYMCINYLYQTYYETDTRNGSPIVQLFIDQGDWPGTNFGTVYTAVETHASVGKSCGSGHTYTKSVELLDENSGAFTEAGVAGGFAWPQPPSPFNSTTQFCWDSSSCGSGYLTNFYSVARAHSSDIAMGVIYKGFDDYNAAPPWGSSRYIAQQCGQIINFTASAISSAGYSSSSQLQYVQVATWNDYEEGTEVETGITNCITLAAPTISSGTLHWSLIKSDATYASTSTINKFQIWTGTSAPTVLYADNISATATSYAAPSPVAGQSVWVYMVGEPLVQNELSPATPNAPVTYYISSTGSDSNNGTSKTTPWLHAPGMNTATGNPAAYTCNAAAGDSFIFQGGGTWHWGNSSATPYIGTWNWTCSGTAVNPVYIGVDTTWYSGSSFARPIFTGDNAISTSFPSSCTYDESTKNTIKLDAVSYVTVDNFEFPGKCWSSPSTFAASIYNYQTCNVTISGNYFHGWTVVSSAIDNHNAILGNDAGGACGYNTQNVIVNNVMDCSDCSQEIPRLMSGSHCNWTALTQGCVMGIFMETEGYDVHQNVLRYVSGMGQYPNNSTTWHDNLTEYLYPSFDGQTHSDVFYMVGAQVGTTHYFYGNIIRHIYNTQATYISCPGTCYIFNNIVYDVMSNGTFGATPTNCFNMQSSVSGGNPTAYFYNNTFDNSVGGCQVQFAPNNSPNFKWGNGTIYVENNHFIAYSGNVLSSVLYCPAGGTGGSCTSADNGNELFQSEATANGQGYTSSNAYQPTAGGSTIGAGANLSTLIPTFSPDLFQSFGYSIGSAAEISGAGGLQAVYPAIYQNPRPAAWDIGAYQFVTTNAYAFNADNLYCSAPGCTPAWGATDGPATLPTAAYNTAIANTPAPNGTVSVSNSSALTSALASATCGQQITLTAGNVFSGNFTIPALSSCGSNYLWITTSALTSLPVQGTRTSPCYSGVTSLQGRPPYACPGTPGTYTAQIITPNSSPAFTFASGASNVRIMGLEITRTPNTGYVAQLVNSDTKSLTNIIVDRTWCHGDENTDETSTCFDFNSDSSMVAIDSYFDDFVCMQAGSCTDSHAMWGGSSTTTDNVFKIVNNFIEASGESVIFGGGAATTIPTNFEIRLNTFFKPRQWNPADPAYNGGIGGHAMIVKNLFELKNAAYVLFEGNTLTNNWSGYSQSGQAFTINAKNQGSGSSNVCNACSVHDVTFRYSSANSTNYLGEWTFGANANFAMAASQYNVSVHDLVGDNLGYPTCYACAHNLADINIWEDPQYTSTATAYHAATFNHITAVANLSAPQKLSGLQVGGELSGTGFQMTGINFTNNVFLTEQYGTYSTGNAAYNCAGSGGGTPSTTIPACWATYTFAGNCIIANGTVRTWPGTNVTSLTTQSSLFTNWNAGNAGNYLLANSEACKGAATDATDPGTNLTTLASVLAGNAAPGGTSYTLTVTNAGGGTVTDNLSQISCPSTCTGTYSSGTNVTLTATANAGYTFSGWTGACSGTGTCVVTMTSNMAVTATFSPIVLAPTSVIATPGVNLTPGAIIK